MMMTNIARIMPFYGSGALFAFFLPHEAKLVQAEALAVCVIDGEHSQAGLTDAGRASSASRQARHPVFAFRAVSERKCMPADRKHYPLAPSLVNRLVLSLMLALITPVALMTLIALAALPFAFLLWREDAAFSATGLTPSWILACLVLAAVVSAVMASGLVRKLRGFSLTMARRVRLDDARRALCACQCAAAIAAESRANSAQIAGRANATIPAPRDSGTGTLTGFPKPARPQPCRGGIAHDPCRSRAPGLTATRLPATSCLGAGMHGLRSHPRPCVKLTLRAGKGLCLHETWQDS